MSATVGVGATGSAGVIGAGTMGLGIAYVFATAGWRTSVAEPDPGRRAALVPAVRERAAAGLDRGRLEATAAAAAPDLLEVVAEVAALPNGLDVIVESVPERAELKHEILAAAERRHPRLLASNTSVLSIDGLAGALRRPQSFVGMHFFNPVWSIPLVEIVRGQASSARTVEAARATTRGIGKEPIVVRDVPGFATSRLDNIAAFEAMRMLEDGVAEAADIDTAMVLGYGHPIGPLRLSDVVGLDVRLDIARELSARYGERYDPPRILVELVAQGRLGCKSGHGFFDWSDSDAHRRH